jgi:hypothetical protein
MTELFHSLPKNVITIFIGRNSLSQILQILSVNVFWQISLAALVQKLNSTTTQAISATI